MKDLEAVIGDLVQWADGGGVGCFMVFRRPDDSYSVAVEQVVKLRELPDGVSSAVRDLMAFEKAVKMEIISNPDGTPDRIKVKRPR